MKKAGIILIFLIILAVNSYSQTTISQGFEGAAGSWNYTSAGTVNTEQARTGTRSIRLGRCTPGCGNGSCPGPQDGTSIIFDPVFLIGSNCNGTFSFYHRTHINGSGLCTNGEGMDTGEGFAVYVKLGSAAWTLLASWAGAGNQAWTWTTNSANNACASVNSVPNPYSYNVPVGTSYVQFKIISIGASSCANFNAAVSSETSSNYNRGDEGLFIDDVTFTTSSPCVLPVELKSFTAHYNFKDVNIDWCTASERNSDFFEIERSKDGLNFETLSKVKAAGNSHETLNYKDIDEQPISGISYYRLKQVDKDGSFRYSQTVATNTEKALEFSVVPNPTDNGDVLINTEYFPNSNQKIEVLDCTGKLIYEQKITGSSTPLKLSEFGKGMYLLRLNSNLLFGCKKLIYN